MLIGSATLCAYNAIISSIIYSKGVLLLHCDLCVGKMHKKKQNLNYKKKKVQTQLPLPAMDVDTQIA